MSRALKGSKLGPHLAHAIARAGGVFRFREAVHDFRDLKSRSFAQRASRVSLRMTTPLVLW